MFAFTNDIYPRSLTRGYNYNEILTAKEDWEACHIELFYHPTVSQPNLLVSVQKPIAFLAFLVYAFN